jgi:hypothetical protein
MEMRRRFWWVNGGILLALAGLYLIFQLYEVEFLEYVVERTVLEKLGPDVDPGPVKGRFARFREWARTGRLTRPDYRVALLDAAAYVEKVEVLEPADLDRIGRYFERGLK